MSALRPIAICRDYEELHGSFRSYVEDINVARLTIDHVSGLQDGYTSKLLAPKPIKNFGLTTIGPFMQSVGLVLVLAQDIDAFNRMRHRLPERLKRPSVPFEPRMLLT